MRKKRLRKLVVYHEGPLYDNFADSEEKQTDNSENQDNSETNNQNSAQQDNEAERFDWEGVHYLLEVGYMKFANKVNTQVSMKFDLILQAVDYVVIKFKILLIKFVIFETIFFYLTCRNRFQSGFIRISHVKHFCASS